jgi:ParB/RepB/Spo0J family partition protein
MAKVVTNLKEISLSRPETYIVDPRLIEDDPGLNERIDFGNLSDLKEQIRVHGVEVELWVRLEKGKLLLTRGYRRMRCVRELIAERRWTHQGVPVKREPVGYKLKDRLIGQITGNEGKEYTILEQGRVFTRLINDDKEPMTRQDIANQTGKSRTHVANAIALAAAPPAVISFVEQKKISESLVIEILRENKGDPEKVVAEVMESFKIARTEGKKRATRQHTSKRKRKNGNGAGAAAAPPNGAGPSTHDAGVSEPAAAEDHVEPGETPLAKLQGLYDSLDRSECDSRCFDTIDFLLQFLRGERTSNEVKAFVRP